MVNLSQLNSADFCELDLKNSENIWIDFWTGFEWIDLL